MVVAAIGDDCLLLPWFYRWRLGMKLVARCAVAFSLLFSSAGAFADTVIIAVPTNWRLQNYTGGTTTAYYTGSTCLNGAVNLAPSTSADDRNRFWSLVMTAKIAGAKVGVYYETASGACNITSFFLSE